MTLQKNSVNKELQDIDKRLVIVDEERDALLARRKVLSEQHSKEINNPQKPPTFFSVNKKIKLFTKLFKGRSGYSFSCHNRFKIVFE